MPSQGEKEAELAKELSARGVATDDPSVEAWLRNLEDHQGGFRRLRRMMRAIPSDPRCHVCYSPFGGPGGKVLGLAGRRPSRKNPNVCAACIEDGPPGGFVTNTGVLFADVRGFTSYAESLSPGEVAATMERFYRTAARTVIDHEGIVDKLVGDQVMALFWPMIMLGDAIEAMVSAAEDLLRSVGYGSDEGPWLPLGVGLDYGEAQLGNLGTEEMRDFTALGDVVNTAARLQASAAAGEILMASHVYDAVRGSYPRATRRELELKGKSAPTTAYAVTIGATAS